MRGSLEVARHEIGILLRTPLNTAQDFAAANYVKTVSWAGNGFPALPTFVTSFCFINDIVADSTIAISSSLMVVMKTISAKHLRTGCTF
jgi:hypothetical protein